jgi:glycosyltransferase involved in cell wall biosynthesis
MKIAMIGHKRVPGREGGIEVVVQELSARMAKLGHKVTVYNRHKRGYKAPKLYKGIKTVDVPTIEKKSTDAVVYAFLASVMAIFGGYDVIHYHAIGPSVFLLIPHIFGKRTIVTVHGLNYKTPKWRGFAAKFIQYGERITAKYADEVIVLSEEQKKYFKEKYNRDTVFIPNGTSIYKNEPAVEIKDKYGLEKNSYILFLSRVVPGKGIEYLLDAYKEVQSDLKLIVAGSTEYVLNFRKMIEEKASQDSRVQLIGYVDGKILRELYSNVRLFVFPSEAEGMPMCLLEALSYNCPCLVSDIPENVEVGNNYVKTFENKNVKDLQRKLESCLNENVQNNSKQYIIDNYSWDIVVQKTLKCYTASGKEEKKQF